MQVHLIPNTDGTSSGFLITKEEIVLVYKDQMARFPNNDLGHAKIENLLDKMKEHCVKKRTTKRTTRSRTSSSIAPLSDEKN